MKTYKIYFDESSLTSDRTQATGSDGSHVVLTDPGVLVLALDKISSIFPGLENYSVKKIEFGENINILSEIQIIPGE